MYAAQGRQRENKGAASSAQGNKRGIYSLPPASAKSFSQRAGIIHTNP
jgi:hypothetical protein